MKRWTLLFIAVALVMLPVVILATGKKEEEAEEAYELSSTATGDQWFVEMTAPFKGETINVIATSGYGFTEALQYSGDLFKDLTGVNVVVVDLPWEQMHDKVMANFIAKSSEYDVVNMDGWQVPAIFNASAVINLQPWIDEGRMIPPDWDIYDFIQNDFKFNGTWPPGGDIYAIPYFPDVIMLFYNKSYFEKYGIDPPKTWQEFETIARKLNGKDLNGDGKPDYGFGLFAKKGPDLPTIWHDRFISFGGSYFEGGAYYASELEPSLNDDAAMNGLKLLIKHLEMAAPGSYDWDVPMISNAFVAGDIAMCEMWTNMPALADDPNQSKIVGEWGAVPIPMGVRRAPQYGGWSIGVPTYSEKKELAFLYCAYVTSKEVMKKTTLERRIPQSRYSNLTEPEILALFPWYKFLAEGLDVGGLSQRSPRPWNFTT